MDTIFIINARYQADQTLNLVRDLQLHKETRLEPRLMQVLCLLAGHAGKLVSRELLVKEIWDDYGGADEGLTQSISALRKVLNDGNKEIIETVPKKGYMLHAVVSSPQQEMQTPPEGKRVGRSPVVLVSGIALLLFAGYILQHTQFQEGSPAEVKGGKNRVESPPGTRVPFQDVNKQEQENYLNTVTTIGPDSTEYKLVSRGDRRPQFFINDQLVSQDDMEKYAALIDQMKKQVWERREKERALNE